MEKQLFYTLFLSCSLFIMMKGNMNKEIKSELPTNNVF